MKRIVGVFLLCLAAVEVRAADKPARPSVLLVLADDMGYGDFSLHGNPDLQTPHLDRFARANTQFERFYVSPLCAPTRASLLTGRYSLRTGVWGVTHNKEAMRPGETTLAEALNGAGYRSGIFGKWHNGEQFPYTPQGQGFDEFFGFHNGHWNSYFDAEVLRGTKFVSTKGYLPDVITDEAVGFLRRNAERPFFCYVAYNTPHSPYQVPDRYFDPHKKKGLDDRLAATYAMCENLDDNFGRLLKALDDLKLSERTIVVFLCDNGPNGQRFNAGQRGAKGSVHEGGCRSALFLRRPGQGKEPQKISHIAAHIDLYPTLLDLCEVAPPKGKPIDGRSLRPLLEGKDDGWPARKLFTHHAPADWKNRYPAAVRTPQYRLVREARSGWQLYDMLDDPQQKKDLAGERADVVKELSQAYETWYDDVSKDGCERFPLPVGHAEEDPVHLHAPQSYFEGGLRFHAGPGFANDWLTGWTDARAKVWFELDVARAGTFEVSLRYLCPKDDAGSRVRLGTGKGSVEAVVTGTPVKELPLPHRDGGKPTYINREWYTLSMGKLDLPAGRLRLTLEALDKPGGQVMDFKGLTLRRVD